MKYRTYNSSGGIPNDISEDYFLNPRITNLIVLDDLMSVVKIETRMADIFPMEDTEIPV